MVAPAPICYRDRIAIHADARATGATNPDYSDEVAASLPAEVQQVAGGQTIRGRTVESITSHVVSMRSIPTISISTHCRITVLSGPYSGQYLYIHRVYSENLHGRPVSLQLHCKAKP